MRILRTSVFQHPHQPPLTTAVRDKDVTVSLERYKAEMLGVDPRAFIIFDEFTLGGHPSIEEATMAAVRRLQRTQKDEQNMAILFFYDVQSLVQLRQGGVLTATIPAPLTREQIAFGPPAILLLVVVGFLWR